MLSSRRTAASPAPWTESTMITPQPCGAAASSVASAARFNGPMTLSEIRPDVLKNAIPASA